MTRELALLAIQVSLRMKMTKRYAIHCHLRHHQELHVRTARTVLAKNVLLVRHHARLAMVHHRTIVSYVPLNYPYFKALVSPRTLMESVQELME